MDTQIGTRPQIGALEIHQAYILASLNWLQQTRSLEMNHVAIEKAKLLGFDHSSVITDAEKYMNNLETFKCYNFYREEPVPEGLIFLQYHKKELLAYPFAKYWNGRTEGVTMSHTACKSTDLFIAAPVDDMQQLVSFTETEIRVIPRSIDPFVFQVTPIGVVIYSKWGEEASDAIFDNVKPL